MQLAGRNNSRKRRARNIEPPADLGKLEGRLGGGGHTILSSNARTSRNNRKASMPRAVG